MGSVPVDNGYTLACSASVKTVICIGAVDRIAVMNNRISR
jgi:hypothetical protein